MNRYESAKELYAKFSIDTEEALKKLSDITVSVHCWQGDDVGGFDSDDALSGGIQTTGNYPGKARTPEELMADIDKAFSLIPGKKKLNLHACYAIFEDGKIALAYLTLEDYNNLNTEMGDDEGLVECILQLNFD